MLSLPEGHLCRCRNSFALDFLLLAYRFITRTGWDEYSFGHLLRMGVRPLPRPATLLHCFDAGNIVSRKEIPLLRS